MSACKHVFLLGLSPSSMSAFSFSCSLNVCSWSYASAFVGYIIRAFFFVFGWCGLLGL